MDSILQQTDGLRTLWQLGGAANDYLRRHPGLITVPRGLPFKLLAANHLDSRIIGLKLLVRLVYPLPVTWKWIRKALQSSREDEVVGGLCELGNLVNRSDMLLSVPGSVRNLLKRLTTSRSLIIQFALQQEAIQFAPREDAGDLE